MDNIKKEKITTSRILRFLIPSILGVLLLMTPFKKDGASTIMVSVISKGINAGVESVVPIYILVLICIVISCSLAIIYKIAKPSWIENNELLKGVSDISNFWLFEIGRAHV